MGPRGSGRPFAWCVPQVRDALQGWVNPWEEAEIPHRAKVGDGAEGADGHLLSAQAKDVHHISQPPGLQLQSVQWSR